MGLMYVSNKWLSDNSIVVSNILQDYPNIDRNSMITLLGFIDSIDTSNHHFTFDTTIKWIKETLKDLIIKAKIDSDIFFETSILSFCFVLKNHANNILAETDTTVYYAEYSTAANVIETLIREKYIPCE